MAQENLNTSNPNDGLGDFLRSAFIKVQNMFTELYSGVVFKVTGYDLSKNDFTDVLKNKLDNIESFADVNIQSDWSQDDDTQDDYIKNKPTIPVLDDYILNGGYLGTGQDLYELILAGGSLTTIPILGVNLTSIGDGFYSTPIPTLTDDQSLIAMLKIYPDQTDLSTYYFKVPEIDGSDLINIEWDGTSDIKILLKIG